MTAHASGLSARDDLPTVVFSMAGAGIKLSAPAEVVEFVAWYTDGYFTRDRASFDAHLVVHSSLPGRLDVTAVGPRTTLRGVDLPGITDATCIADDSHAALHLIVHADTETTGVHTVRLLRAMLLNRLLAEANPFVHAACAAVDGAGVAFVGPRGCGKTTLLLHAAMAGVDIVGNDKISMAATSSGVDALGFPVKIGVRAGSVLALDQGSLRAFLETQWDQQTGGLERRADDLATRIFARPQDLAAAASSGISPQCRLAAIIEPRLQNGVGAPRLERLSREETGALLNAGALRGPTQVFPQQAALSVEHRTQPAPWPDLPAYRLTYHAGSGRGSVDVIRDLLGSANLVR